MGIICLPVTVYYAFITTSFLLDADDDEPCFDKRERLLIVLLAWLLTPTAIPLFTVALIVYATYSKVGGLVVRLVQGIFEANLQAIFGSSISALRNLLRIKKLFKLNRKNAVLYVILVKGLAGNAFSRFMQIAGIMVSLLSVARACSNIFIIGSFNNTDKRQTEPGVCYLLKSLAFFLPHVVFRTTTTAFVAAFLKWYSLIPLAVYLIVNMVITRFLKNKYSRDWPTGTGLKGSFSDYALSLFTLRLARAKPSMAVPSSRRRCSPQQLFCSPA